MVWGQENVPTARQEILKQKKKKLIIKLTNRRCPRLLGAANGASWDLAQGQILRSMSRPQSRLILGKTLSFLYLRKSWSLELVGIELDNLIR